MSQFRPLANIAFSIKTHLAVGGQIHDDVGMEFVEKYTLAAERIPPIKELMDEYDMNRHDLMTVFIAGIHALMPNPCVRIPIDALAASLVFQEPEKHLCSILMLSDVRQHTVPEGKDKLTYKREALYHWSSEKVLEIKMAHDLAYGASKFVASGVGGGLVSSKTGCSSSVVLLLSGTAILSYFLL